MLKLKLQYFGHLIRRTDSLEKTLMLAKIELICILLVAQSCPTFCDTMDHSPPDSSVHGIFQARILEWVAIPFFRGSS